MNLVKITAVALIMAGGLGLAYGGISSGTDTRDTAPVPVGKCQGACRTSNAGFAAGTLIRATRRQCAGEQTAAFGAYRMALTSHQRTAALPFLE